MSMNMEFTEKVITLVKQHPCLYDCRVKDYKNILAKERLWDKIALELNQSSDTIRAKWKNLKDGYSKYKKKKNKYGNWVWGPYLQFLDGAAAIRNKIPPDPSESPNSGEAREGVDAVDTEFIEFESKIEEVDASTNNSSIHEFLSLRDPFSRPRKRQASEDEYAEDKLPIEYNNVEKKDSIDLLFESYAKSLKQMRPRTQAKIKIRLAQIFADAELEDLQSDHQNEGNNTTVYPAMSSTRNEKEVYPSSSNYDNSIKRE